MGVGTISDPGYTVDGEPQSPDAIKKELAKKGLPPPAPDITSKLLDSATRTDAAWMAAKRGRRSTFLTGQAADTTQSSPTLLGG